MVINNGVHLSSILLLNKMIYLQLCIPFIGIIMDVRQLQIFLHLSGSLHFAKTAQAMHVSPSALSRIIQRLEQNCGAELLQRDNRSVQLTKAGQTFRVFCESVVAQWQQTLSDINHTLTNCRGSCPSIVQ